MSIHLSGDPRHLVQAEEKFREQIAIAQPDGRQSTAMFIEVSAIVPNPEQPRSDFDQDALRSLARSIQEVGVITPIVVESAGDGYILHDGERRWRAAQLAGLAEIPAVVVQPADDEPAGDRLTRALVANVQREDLRPLDVARAYQRLSDLGLTDQQIADQVGRSRSSVTNARRLLDLPEEAQALAAVEGVSERSLAALLPMYQLPPENLAQLENRHWNTPSDLLKKIRQGEINSDGVRGDVTIIIRDATLDLDRATFPLDHPFAGDGLKVHSPRCDQCPARVRSKDELRCPHHDCFQAKTHRWQADALQAASEASGLPILPVGTDYWESEHFFGLSKRLLGEAILAGGCENLRLEYKPGDGGLRLPGHDNVRVICYHGKSKSCKCLRSAKAKQTRDDPDRVAERAAQARLKAEIVEPYAAALAQAIADGQTGVWLRILRNVAYNFKSKGGDLTLDDIRARIATAFVEHAIPYDGHQRLDAARQAVQRSFDEMSLPYPGQTEQSVPAQLRGRLDRIQSWINRLYAECPSLPAVRGNLDNLEKLTDDFDAFDDGSADAEELDGFLQDLAGAYETLDTLHRLMLNPLCDLNDFDHVSWLVTVPPGDGNFKGHLERASHWVIQYTLALVDGRDGHKTRVEALKHQLSKFRSERSLS